MPRHASRFTPPKRGVCVEFVEENDESRYVELATLSGQWSTWDGPGEGRRVWPRFKFTRTKRQAARMQGPTHSARASRHTDAIGILFTKLNPLVSAVQFSEVWLLPEKTPLQVPLALAAFGSARSKADCHLTACADGKGSRSLLDFIIDHSHAICGKLQMWLSR